MNNSICTSYEQSKSLLELGMDPNTADMKYDPRWDIPVIISEYDYDNHLNYDPEFENTDIPAWSLTALLALMPKIKFFTDEDAYEPCISRYGDKYICSYNCGGTMNITDSVAFVYSWAEHGCGISPETLDMHIRWKMKKNELRPYKHGNKKY